MNIDLNIKFNTIGNLTTPVRQISTTASLMLYPMFCIESDVVDPYHPDAIQATESNLQFIRQIIFNSSITVLNETRTLEKLKIISDTSLFALRRDYTICLAQHAFTIQVHQDLVTSSTRSKRLGDFSVSTSKNSDPEFITKLISSSTLCIKEMKALIKAILSERLLPEWFIKGSSNIQSNGPSTSLWWPKEMFPYTKDAYGSWKQPWIDGMYKKATYGFMNSYGGPQGAIDTLYLNDGQLSDSSSPYTGDF